MQLNMTPNLPQNRVLKPLFVTMPCTGV